jgi:hypothetical protein
MCTDTLSGLWLEGHLTGDDQRLKPHSAGKVEGQALTALRERHAQGQ